ncbi:hypothetical protein T03_9193 [Trichinella britovi]|uniref:Uncharacterized protein n=1 Tax=Trichinella britovi TaxID=45882 RepID=A0A0V0YZ24_TRIBR|nr:hypothetical protein T03_9193 [Trichinella britovi]
MAFENSRPLSDCRMLGAPNRTQNAELRKVIPVCHDIFKITIWHGLKIYQVHLGS